MRNNSNGRKERVGLWVVDDIAMYYSRGEPIPCVFDSRLVAGADYINMHKQKEREYTKGLTSNTEFVRAWFRNPVVVRDGAGLSIKQMLMAERKIPKSVERRIITKFTDGDVRNMRSSNILLVELVNVWDNYYRDGSYNCRIQSTVTGTTEDIGKNDILNFFYDHYKDVLHPIALAHNGNIIARKNS